MRALESITGYVIYNPAYTYKLQLKTTKENYVPISMTNMKWKNINSVPYVITVVLLGPDYVFLIFSQFSQIFSNERS